MSSVIVSTKFSANKWTLIEKPLDVVERERSKILCDLGDRVVYGEKLGSNLVVIGDYYYLSIRDKIGKHIRLGKIDSVRAVGGKMSKKNKIILENSTRIVEGKLATMLAMFRDMAGVNYSEVIFANNYIEMRIIILMKLVDHFVRENNVAEIEELLIACNKIMKLLENSRELFDKICVVEGVEIGLSGILINDFLDKIGVLRDRCELRLYDIANRRPKLIFETKYDGTIAVLKMQPYRSQVELVNCVRDNLENGCLVYLKTLTGMGKTTSVLSLVKYLSGERERGGYKVLFCCSNLLDNVRVQVAKLMFNFQLKFGIGNAIGRERYQVKLSWNCKVGKEAVGAAEEAGRENRGLIDYAKIYAADILICDYVTTYLILKDNIDFKFVLFFDEPTLMTDDVGRTETLEYLSKILFWMPKNTVLSSATLPSRGEIENVENHFRGRFGEANVVTIMSSKVLVGCLVRGFDNVVITPHVNCRDWKELRAFLEKMCENPLLGKFYTLPYLMNLNRFLRGYGLDVDMECITTFEQDNILENILMLLGRVDGGVDFEAFRRIGCAVDYEYELDERMVDVREFERVDYAKMFRQAFKYVGVCLVAVGNPMEFVERYWYEVAEVVKRGLGVRNIGEEYERYVQGGRRVEGVVDNLERRVRDDDDGRRDEMMEDVRGMKPVFKFRECFQINTLAHFAKYSKYVKRCDLSVLCNRICYEELNVNEFDVCDNLKMLLYMGVGVYSLTLDEAYTNCVLGLLGERKLAYVVSGDEFCYGSNFPISKIVIDDSLGGVHSINTVLQLIGRTSRVGKSYFGEVFVDRETKGKLVEFFGVEGSRSVEGENISMWFERTVREVEEEETVKREKVEEKRVALRKLEEDAGKRERFERMLRRKEEDDLKAELLKIEREKRELEEKQEAVRVKMAGKRREQEGKEDAWFRTLYKK